jgi:hypothetical protein
MKTLRIALLATATAAATILPAATAHADPTQYDNFLSPSGNINCSIMLEPPFAANGVNNPATAVCNARSLTTPGNHRNRAQPEARLMWLG